MQIIRRTIIPGLLILVLFLFTEACSCNCGNNSGEGNTLKGYIVAIGNDPFSKLAVRTEDDKTYVLQLSKELKEELSKKQGYYYYIQYGDIREEAGISTVVVEKAIPIKQSEK